MSFDLVRDVEHVFGDCEHFAPDNTVPGPDTGVRAKINELGVGQRPR